MKIKNSNLKWYVMYHDFNSNKIKRQNILGIEFAQELAKKIKQKKISSKSDLMEFLKRDFMYHYWSKCEYEIAVGGLWVKDVENLEKKDVWFQLENNLETITDYIIYKMKINFNTKEECEDE